MDDLNLSTLAKHFSDEAAAWELVEQMRWPNGPECPHCGEVDHAYLLKPRSGQRTTAKGTVSYRRWWKCGSCRRQFSVLVGTIFENTKVPLSKWLLAIYMLVSAKNGVAANELKRTLDVSDRTAWHMLHRVRKAMERQPLCDMLRGTVVADETWFGGDPRNRHGGGNLPVDKRTPVKVVPGQNLWTDKTPIVTMISKDTGEARSQAVTNVTAANLGKVLGEQVDMANTHLQTDEGSWYRPLAQQFASHQTVNHSQGEYARGGVSINRVEGFFGQLKRSLDGTHHHVSREHLPRYLAEFDFRYSTCKESDSERMLRLMAQAAGRRLPYSVLISH